MSAVQTFHSSTKLSPSAQQDQGSFRDPAGFIFSREGEVYRQVQETGRKEYEAFMASGLYKTLSEQGLIVTHTEEDISKALIPGAAKVLKPQAIPFISYPYEWCFSEFKDAALLTLKIQKLALEKGLSLRDASAFNCQFLNGRAIFIDTLSFETLKEDKPWVAYGQFCRHFLAPLALMSYCDDRLSQLWRSCIDGIPLDLASKLLPFKTRFKFGLLTHIHLHASLQNKHADSAREKSAPKVVKISKFSLLAMIDSMTSLVESLHWKRNQTEWGDYYSDTNYSDSAMQRKRVLVEHVISTLKPTSVWDLGGNIGNFSRLASLQNIPTVCFDIDPLAVERNYLQIKRSKEKNLLPLILDLTCPSPDLGWDNSERKSINSRGPVDLAMALALIHHLAISNNLPLEKIANSLSRLAKNVLIEFVPKTDSQVKRLLTSREDIFPNYTKEGFEAAFGKYFQFLNAEKIEGSDRTLYLLKTL